MSVLRRLFRFSALLSCLVATSAFLSPLLADSRIKDLAAVESIRGNPLIGYGLAVGLNGTGDGLNNSPFTRQSLESMFKGLGVNIQGLGLNTRNVAAVMLTATLPPFAMAGTSIDVAVSAIGDASSLNGGILLAAPLLGADGEVYAVAQGSVIAGGFAAQGEAASVSRGVPTSGRIPNGAMIERELAFHLRDRETLRLSLRNPDLTTARRIALSINRYLGFEAANAENPATVSLRLGGGIDDMVDLLTDIEGLRVAPDQVARVIVDESSGAIVIGKDVRISTVAIAQGNLTIRVTETPQVSQPAPFSEGETVVVPRTEIAVDDENGSQLGVLRGGVSLESLVDGLNALGVTPRDIIAILQSIKAAGALHAELETL